jgi:hypothetical protein
MKAKLFNRLSTTACLLAGMASLSTVLAESTGNNFIGGPNYIDVFKLKCPATSRGVYITISDLPFVANSTPVGVTLLRNGVNGTADGTEDLIASTPASLDNGPGTYYLVYRHFGITAGGDDYTSHVFCRNASGVLIEPVPGSFRRILNQ